MYEIKPNAQFNSNEIYFNGKPSQATRDALKAAGFRWHGVKKCWYGRATAEEIAAAINGTGEQGGTVAQAATTAASVDGLQDKRAEYIALLLETERDPNEWRKYYEKSTSAAYQIGSHLIGFEKPHIKTRFYFGYGYCGVSTAEQRENAASMAEHASTSAEHFKHENIKDFDDILQSIEKVQAIRKGNLPFCDSGRGICEIEFRQLYYTNKNVYCVSFVTWNDKDEQPQREYLSDSELATYKKAVEIERAKMEKRINTYLKKYGLSNIKIGTYLSD